MLQKERDNLIKAFSNRFPTSRSERQLIPDKLSGLGLQSQRLGIPPLCLLEGLDLRTHGVGAFQLCRSKVMIRTPQARGFEMASSNTVPLKGSFLREWVQTVTQVSLCSASTKKHHLARPGEEHVLHLKETRDNPLSPSVSSLTDSFLQKPC